MEVGRGWRGVGEVSIGREEGVERMEMGLSGVERMLRMGGRVE